MTALLPQATGTSLMFAEGGLTAICVAVAFCWPRLGSNLFARVEGPFRRLAQRQRLSVIVVGVSALLLRLALLPVCPIPLPFTPGDFSFLLAADTFASGRLTNPTPAMWTHFETIHVTMQPTYMSMYFPMQGLIMAASRVLTGTPWYGVLLASVLMCAALCWMLQAWLPPAWALLGGILAVIHIGLFSYWINTYHSGGCIMAFAGALVLGALPRLIKKPQLRYGLLMAVGIAIFIATRPYEGMLLCLPVAFVLARWAFFAKNRPRPALLVRCGLAPLLLILAAGAWMGYYDRQAFGSPLTLPYTVDRSQYATVPYFVWQSQRPEPAYRHAELRRYYDEYELTAFRRLHGLSGFLSQTLIKALGGVLFFTGIALLPPLLMLRRVLLDRRIRFLVLCVLVLAAGLAFEVFLLPHYLAAFTAAIYAIGLQSMRHLRLWRPAGQPVGLAMTRLTVLVLLLMAGLRTTAGPLHFQLAEWPVSKWNIPWYGPGLFGTQRAQVETALEALPGPQLAIVRYIADRNSSDEWVYNSANIDSSKVIWARQMQPADDLQLIHYYSGRTVWLIQPDTDPVAITSYRAP